MAGEARPGPAMNDTAWFLLVVAGLAIALAALYRANARDRAARSAACPPRCSPARSGAWGDATRTRAARSPC
ncbi:MAG: hypothetical protein O9972_28155 [Burkholderiales bacterium]|nr:hypothetical protein [Burkholderiales bacterium]